MADDPFITKISRHIWDSKYRFRDGATVHDQTIDDTWRRIARHTAYSISAPELPIAGMNWRVAFSPRSQKGRASNISTCRKGSASNISTSPRRTL